MMDIHAPHLKKGRLSPTYAAAEVDVKALLARDADAIRKLRSAKRRFDDYDAGFLRSIILGVPKDLAERLCGRREY